MVAEVRGRITQAMAEADGDETAALAHLATPELLAVQVLKERGILGVAPSLPEASAWRRAAALSVDVAFWILVMVIFSAPVQLLVANVGRIRLALVVVACIFLAAPGMTSA